MTKNENLTPLGALGAGAVGGAVGTAGMDLLWYRRYRRAGGTDRFLAWETSAGTESYDSAGAPAQVGRRLVEGFLQSELPPSTARGMNTVVHLATGVGWGAVHGAIVGSARRRPSVLAAGLATGAVAWGASYAMLGTAGIYQPIWTYPPAVLAQDLSAHLVFGLGMGTAFRLLSGRAD